MNAQLICNLITAISLATGGILAPTHGDEAQLAALIGLAAFCAHQIIATIRNHQTVKELRLRSLGREHPTPH